MSVFKSSGPCYIPVSNASSRLCSYIPCAAIASYLASFPWLVPLRERTLLISKCMEHTWYVLNSVSDEADLGRHSDPSLSSRY